MADSTCRKQGLSPRGRRGVAKHPCKASFFAGVFFCLAPALAGARFDVLPEIVQDRLPAIALLLLGMGLPGVEHHHHIDALYGRSMAVCLLPVYAFRLPETVGSSFLHRACPSLQRQLAVRYNRQQFP